MGYTDEGLKGKITEIYPEIRARGISLDLDFSKEENAYIIKLTKGTHEFTTHLKKIDADECMNNVKCIYLGVQVGEFIKNFEEAE